MRRSEINVRPLHITFDSNVWRKVASPYAFPKEPSAAIFEKLNLLSKSKIIIPCLSETIFNLEGVEKIKRQRIIGNDRGKIEKHTHTFKEGVISSGFTIGPDLHAHPGSSDYLSKHLNDARLSNFKILYCPRLGGLKNRDILESDYLNCSEEISNKFSDTVCEIESWGCGISQVIAIGCRFAEFWLDGLQVAPASEQENIAKAVAEWSDADSVAAHIAYGNDIFCTRDRATSAGSKSVFHSSNITRLREKYGFLCQQPEELEINIEVE
jgi:hypothetical protein